MVRSSSVVFLFLKRSTRMRSAQSRASCHGEWIRICNNWDLVDLSCPTLVGGYLLHQTDHSLLYRLAESDNLWEQRIAIVSTITLIRHDQFADTLALSKQLMNHKHDLMHKAVGWMLREIGKRDRNVLTDFLDE